MSHAIRCDFNLSLNCEDCDSFHDVHEYLWLPEDGVRAPRLGGEEMHVCEECVKEMPASKSWKRMYRDKDGQVAFHNSQSSYAVSRVAYSY